MMNDFTILPESAFEELKERFTELYEYFRPRVLLYDNCLGLKMFPFNNDQVFATCGNAYITIYLASFIKQHIRTDLNTMLVDTIVHELMHFNQNINFIRYGEDIPYRIILESENIFNTTNYLLEHVSQIREDLGIELDTIHLRNLNQKALQDAKYIASPYTDLYHRYANLLYSSGMHLLGDYNFSLEKLWSYDSIDVEINGNKFPIKRDWVFLPIDKEFNETVQREITDYSKNTVTVGITRIFNIDDNPVTSVYLISMTVFNRVITPLKEYKEGKRYYYE